MVKQFWGRTTIAAEQTFQMHLVFYAAFLAIAGPFALGVSWLLSRSPPPLRYLVPAALGGALWAWLLFQHVTLWASSVPARLLLWWGGLVLAAPLGALILHGWKPLSNFLRPRDLDEQLAEQRQLLQRQDERLSRRALHQEDDAYLPPPHWLNLGVFMKGDRLPDYLGVRREENWLLLNERLLSQHLLILGTTGAGKTETIKRLVWETLQMTQRDIFFIDGKGDETLASEIAQLIYAARQEPVPIFKLGFDMPGSVYHGFRGQPADLYNRLCALVGVEEASGDAQFYADINRDLLQLICHAPAGPPRSFEEVRRRVSQKWLLDAYRENEVEYATLKAIDAKYFESLRVRLRPLSRAFAPVVDETGFVLEESAGAVFCLRTQSVGDTARRFLHFFVEDIKDFVGKRQHRPGLLIIDEFGAFSNQNIVAILTLARSADLGVVLATQDVASLGDENIRRLILANTRTKLLMATDFPQEVAELAGTIHQIEPSIQHQDGEATGMGSARVQHAFRVDMNETGGLQAGEAFLIRQRHAAKVRVKRIGDIPIDEQAIAHFEKAQPPGPVRKEKREGGKQIPPIAAFE